MPLIVECVTDNINRTVAEIRVAFRKGQLGASGSVPGTSTSRVIEASPDTPDADPEMAAIEAGAQDFRKVKKRADPVHHRDHRPGRGAEGVPEQGFTVLSAKLGYLAKNPVSGLSDEQMAEVEAFLEAWTTMTTCRTCSSAWRANPGLELWARACVWSGLAAIAVYQMAHQLADPPLSRASPLPHKPASAFAGHFRVRTAVPRSLRTPDAPALRLAAALPQRLQHMVLVIAQTCVNALQQLLSNTPNARTSMRCNAWFPRCRPWHGKTPRQSPPANNHPRHSTGYCGHTGRHG